MGALTIRKIDDEVKHALRKRAAEHGVSMEQYARDVLARVLAEPTPVRERRASIIEDLRAIGIKPAEPFDLKKASDEMWEEGLVWPPSLSTHPR